VYRNAAWNNFSHTWSLAIEEQFYLLWPLVIFCLPQRYFKRVVVLLVLAVIIFLLPYPSNNFISVLLPANLITLCAGSLLAYYIKYHFGQLNKYKNYIYILGILSCFLYAIHRNHTIFSLAPERICHALIALMLIVFAVSKPNAMNVKPLVFLGKISYGLYLYHYVIGYIPDTVFSSLTANPAVLYIIKLLLLFSLAIASYLLIEKKLIQYSKTRLLVK
jgi:peptidoglycan/LPS O-acetylase OafA/YrhL